MSGMAKYMEIYIDIRDKINQNKYEINEKLPDGDSLARVYDCSKLTVKKALDMLVQEGMVIRRRGAGTFVKSHSTNGGEFALGPMSGLVNTFGKDNIKSKVILFSIEKPSKEVAEKLEMQDDYIYRIIRMREVGHKAYSIEHTYMPLAIIPGLEPRHLEDSIYNYIRDDLKLKMQSAHVWVRGDKSNQEDSKLLDLEEPTFMMEIEKLAHLEGGRVFEYSITRHTYESFVFETVFVQN
ncbi:GntR family transcriptional regulator [Listeria monocytogenes]|nr:GntR family transcriptional regulator [Listeria monocytogenes]EAE1084823.1 GntR family transcriptional regulator [Listeria monocytogenes]EAE1097032.1 GntR family transcriptional regulator [Listeria monocytogenes]EAE1128389.1 GntR family transcriptional regulator [Listeria monocytogenes]EAF6915844.1 GntR family transcriptional regulator [Listeria monocytogenes]